MSMLKQLIERVNRDDLEAIQVLTDYLLSEGLDATTAHVVFERLLVPLDMKAARPYIFWDTNRVPEGLSVVTFFRNLQEKTKDETNCVMAQRLPSGETAKFTRLVMTAENQLKGHLEVRINHQAPMGLPFHSTKFSYPLALHVRDNDDIMVKLYATAPTATKVQVALHGWHVHASDVIR